MEEFKFKIAGKNYSTKVVEEESGSLLVTVNGKTYQVELPPQQVAPRPIIRPAVTPSAAPSAARPTTHVGDTEVFAPLPGTITKVVVEAGKKVKRGDVLVIMEAMKMANDIVAECDGTIKAVHVTEGQNVGQGEVLVEFLVDESAQTVKPVTPASPRVAPAPLGDKSVTAPLPGTITKVVVQVGQSVKAGDCVVLMEAMKMENSITAEAEGIVKTILVQPGMQVQSGEVLVEIS